MKTHKSKVLFEKKKIPNLLILLALFTLGIITVLITRPSYFVNILIVYLPGMVYAFTLLKKSGRKILLFGLCSIIFIIPVEVLARLTNSWDVASIFPRVLGIAPVENIVYGLVNIIYPLLFYEYFYDEDRNRAISKRWKVLMLLYTTLFGITFSLFFINQEVLKLNYWIIGIVILVPVFTMLMIYKKHILKDCLYPQLFLG